MRSSHLKRKELLFKTKQRLYYKQLASVDIPCYFSCSQTSILFSRLPTLWQQRSPWPWTNTAMDRKSGKLKVTQSFPNPSPSALTPVWEHVWGFWRRKQCGAKASSTGGRRGWARDNGWSGISGMASNTSNTWFPWFPGVWCHSIRSNPDIIVSRPPLSSLHWLALYCFHLTELQSLKGQG